MHRFTFSIVIAALMLLGGAAQAQNSCNLFGDFPEAGLCGAYCAAMKCDLINDGDAFTSPQASEAACRNVAATFLSVRDGVPRRDVNPVDAMDTLDPFCGCVPPNPCGGGGGD